MGLISTMNFIGYLLAAVSSGLLTVRYGSRRLIFLSLLLVGSTMVLIGFAENFYFILFLYTVTGIGAGFSNVPMQALVPAWFSSKHRGKAAGLIVMGNGFAIIYAGKLIPILNTMNESDGWRTSWEVLGITVIAIAMLCWQLLRNKPESMEIRQYGYPQEKAKTIAASALVKQIQVYKKGIIYYLGLIYFLFGFTYVIYATFLVTFLVQEKGFSEQAAGNLWSWIGVLSIFSGPIFGSLSDKAGRKSALFLVFTLQSISYFCVALDLPESFLILSIALFGIVAWSIPPIMVAIVGDYIGTENAGKAFGFITFIFGFGQISGPVFAGTLAELSGSFVSGFRIAALLAGIAALLSLFVKKTGEQI